MIWSYLGWFPRPSRATFSDSLEVLTGLSMKSCSWPKFIIVTQPGFSVSSGREKSIGGVWEDPRAGSFALSLQEQKGSNMFLVLIMPRVTG